MDRPVPYSVWTPGKPRETVVASDSWRARKAYAWKDRVATVECIARPVDMIDDKWDRLTLADHVWLSDDELVQALKED